MTIATDRQPTVVHLEQGRAPVYGIDIETDTAVDGLDPRVGRVLAVAVAHAEGEVVFDDADESALIAELDRFLIRLRPGVLVTWNGAAFDLPYLASRAQMLRVPLGLCLEPDPNLVVRGAPLPGHDGAYRARWHAHGHLDAFRAFRADLGRTFGLSCALKSVASLVGLPFIEQDASRVHELSDEDRSDYVASDARCTRSLALRRWPTAERGVDRLRSGPPAPVHLR